MIHQRRSHRRRNRPARLMRSRWRMCSSLTKDSTGLRAYTISTYYLAVCRTVILVAFRFSNKILFIRNGEPGRIERSGWRKTLSAFCESGRDSGDSNSKRKSVFRGGEENDHRIGWDVSGRWDIEEPKVGQGEKKFWQSRKWPNGMP
jgi:hypothetical protein